MVSCSSRPLCPDRDMMYRGCWKFVVKESSLQRDSEDIPILEGPAVEYQCEIVIVHRNRQSRGEGKGKEVVDP